MRTFMRHRQRTFAIACKSGAVMPIAREVLLCRSFILLSNEGGAGIAHLVDNLMATYVLNLFMLFDVTETDILVDIHLQLRVSVAAFYRRLVDAFKADPDRYRSLAPKWPEQAAREKQVKEAAENRASTTSQPGSPGHLKVCTRSLCLGMEPIATTLTVLR